MKTLNKTLICTALVGASVLALAPLANATPELEVAIGSSGCSTVKSTSSDGTVTWAGASGAFDSIVVSGLGVPLSGPPDLLNSDTVDAHSSGSGTIYLCVTETGVSALSGNALSSFASNENLPSGWHVTETTYADAADTAFGEAELLGAHTFTGSPSNSSAPSILSFGAPFSLTEIYAITASGRGTTNDAIDITTVPEPATFALLAVGLLGTAIGLRRRRRS
jgi:PEP-CTERM motif